MSTKILISAALNQGKAIGDLNAGIKALAKHPSLQKLSLQVNIDKSFTTAINSFVDATKKLSSNLEAQNRVVKETVNEFRNLDGTVTKTTQQILANGEMIEKTRTKHDANKKAMQDESKAYESQRKTISDLKLELEGYTKASEKVNKNKAGEINSITSTYKNASTGSTVSVNTDANGYVNNSAKLTEYLKLQQSTNSKLEALDRDHYNALKTNAAKAEALDKAHYQALQKNRELDYKNLQATNRAAEALDKSHYQALQQNQSRDQQYARTVADTQQKINDAKTKFSGNSSAVASLTELETKLKGISNIGDFKSPLASLNNDLKRTISQLSEGTSHAHSFGDQLKHTFSNMLMYAGVGSIFYGMVNALKSGIQHISEMDAAMTNLRKVTDETDTTYNRFLITANETANSIGGVTIDVVKSTTEWARLGYTIQQAQTLAKQTLVYQNVGDISSAEEASKSLISTIKGFGIQVDAEGKNITKIVDIYNEVGNKFAISSAGIGEALRRSAASMSEAGNTIEESVALATAANSTIQDPARVGQALKTISMRLRGVSEDGEDLSNLVPTLEKKFGALGLSLKKDDSTFKSTYEIFRDLSTVWDDLSDFQQADILESVAGKLQGNIAASLISNFKDAQDSLNTALNSTGSAARENEKYIESIAGRMNIFKNAISEFWTKSIDSAVIKGVINLLTDLVKTFGNLGNVLVFTTALFIAFKSQAIISTVKSLYSAITALGSTGVALNGVKLSANGAAISMTGLQVAMGWFGLAATALTTLYFAFKQTNAAAKDNAQIIEDSNKKYEELGNKLQETENYYKDNYKLIQSNTDVKNRLFQMQNDLIDTYGLESQGLDLVNGKYDEQILKLKDLNKEKLNQEIKDTKLRVNAAKEVKYNSTIEGKLGKPLTGHDYTIEGNKNLNVEEYYKELLAIREKIYAEDKSLFEFSDSFSPKNAQEWESVLNTIQDKLDEIKPTIDDIASVEGKQKEKLKNDTLESFEAETKLNDKQKDFFDSINSITSQAPLEGYQKEIKDVLVLTSKLKDDGSNFVTLVNSLKEFAEIKGNPELVKQIDDFMHSSLDAKSSVVNLEAVLSNINASYDENSESVKELNQVIADLSKGNDLNSETIGDLTKKYPQLAKYAKKTAEGWTLEKDAVVALRDEKINFFKKDVENEKKNGLSVVNASIQKIQAYGLQVKSVNSLAEAKQALLEIDGQLNNPKKSDLANSGTNLYPFLPDSFGSNISKNLLKTVDDYNNAVTQKNTDAQKVLRDQIAKNIKDMEDYAASGDALLSALQDPDLGTTTSDNDKLNDSYSDTVEILTDLQKQLKNVQKLQDEEENKRRRMRQSSKEYQESLKKTIELKKQELVLLEKGSKDPAQLVSTKVQTTVKTSEGSNVPSSSVNSSSASIDNMLTNALGLASEGKFKYDQVSGEFKGTYEEFVQGATSDCSQFVQEMFKEFLNTTLPRTAAEQAKQGVAVQKADLQAGDLVFFNTTGKDNSHVGIYTGNGKFVQMGDSGLKESDMNSSYWADKYQGARRVDSSFSISGSSSGVKTSKNGNKTTKTTGATTSEIEKAAEQNEQDIITKQNEIYDSQVQYLEEIKYLADNAVEEQERLIAASQKRQEKLDPTSVEFKKENDVQINLKTGTQSIKNQEALDLQKAIKEYGIESDEYDKLIKQLQTERADIQSEKYQTLVDNLNTGIDASKKRIDDLDTLIQQSQNKMAQFAEGSSEYNKEVNNQIELKKKQKKENDDLIASLENLMKSENLDAATKKEFKAILDELKLKDYTSDIKDLNAELIASKATPLIKEIDDLNHKLDVSKATLKGFKEGTKEYNDELKTQITITNELIAATNKLKEYAEKQSNNQELSASVREDYKKQVQELTLSLYDYADAIKDIRETYADNVIEKYKKMLQEQQKLRDAAYDKEKEAEDARHETRIDNLDDEMSKFEEVINAQSKSLDREVAEEDYTDQLAQLQKEKAELDSKFSSLSLDDSLEAKSKRADLQKEIDAKAEEITKLQRDREITIRKEGLSDQLEDRKNAVDKEKKLEDDKNKSIIKGIEANKKLNDDYYDGLLNDEQYFYNMKQNLMSEDTVKVQNELSIVQAAYDTFFKELEKNSSVYASKIASNLKYSLGLDKDYANNFPTSDGTGNSTGNSNGTVSPVEAPNNATPVDSMNKRNVAWDEYLSNKQKAEQMQNEMKNLLKDSADYKNKQTEIERLRVINEAYRKQYGFQDGSYADLSKLTKFHTGGIVGEKGTTTKSLLENEDIPAILKKGEGIIDNPRDFFKEIAGNVMDNLSKALSSFNNAKLFNSSNLQPITNSLSIKIDNVTGTKEGAKLVTESVTDLWNKITKSGQ